MHPTALKTHYQIEFIALSKKNITIVHRELATSIHSIDASTSRRGIWYGIPSPEYRNRSDAWHGQGLPNYEYKNIGR